MTRRTAKEVVAGQAKLNKAWERWEHSVREREDFYNKAIKLFQEEKTMSQDIEYLRNLAKNTESELYTTRHKLDDLSCANTLNWDNYMNAVFAQAKKVEQRRARRFVLHKKRIAIDEAVADYELDLHSLYFSEIDADEAADKFNEYITKLIDKITQAQAMKDWRLSQ